ncbi:PMCA-type calcium-translocating P-type ATPase [Zychaea mexicana]|uniref:PMCA-type calcium-translocating P-type ATPase n=1 Tax=Zychaea mexicana TaxID=64656 RepID=UPI0022FF1AD5|nr:PMCA-type calcium-translocating P-type ATPase [Zychaea mexicana]KAI9497916.1 PMCA-type calcium-translocating P-type ATPase [Zychaea mexicana]
MLDDEEERRPLLGSNSLFSISPRKLMELVDPKNPALLRKLGGIDAIASALHVDTSNGISDDLYQARQSVFGYNDLPKAKSKSFWRLIVAAYNDKTIIMLTVAAIVSLGIGIGKDYSAEHPPGQPRIGWVEGTAILVAVLAVTLTNAINDYQKERQFRKLNAKKEDKRVTVLRMGREQRINAHDLVVGDILIIEPGDVVLADGLYVTGYNLVCDESSATGESEAVKKHPAGCTCSKDNTANNNIDDDNSDSFILSGSKVLEGVGRVLVIAVGTNSYYGKTMMALRHDPNTSQRQENTPLQLKLDVLAEQIAKFGIVASLTMLVTLTIKYYVTADHPSGTEIASTVVNIVIQTITIIVVAVPEGLPMAVTMALAFATTQMLKDNNLVRVLAACETMGNSTTICTDKTGTLTQNQMTVVKGTLGMEQFTEASAIQDWAQRVDGKIIQLVVEGAAVNSTAYEDVATNDDGKKQFLGSKTEIALLVLANKLGGDYVTIRRHAQIAKLYPFASKKKTMTTIIQLGSTYRAYTKGASEIVLRSCTHYIDAKGETCEMDTEARQQWERVIDKDASEALRTLALAYIDMEQDEYSALRDEDDFPLENLVMIGAVAIEDPLRPGVVESVAAFRRAGVFVRMVTGDNIKTATAIARNAGILTKGGIVLSASELREMSPEEQRQRVRRMQVLARSSPTDKTTVVVRLQELDQVVGMTGDGTNDGPALRLADVGFSMGVTGTEVAKEASDIVLMDDNFNSILKALLWGRTVNDGVRKFLTFQLTVNVAAVVISFVSAVTSNKAESVLSAVQLLWVNLIMDTLAALALATERPTSDLLDRKPASKFAHLINYRMVKMILGQAVFQIAVNLVAVYAGPQIFGISDEAVLRTMVFNIFVFLQVFNEINCRRIDGSLNVFKNITHDWIFVAVQAAVVVCQVIIVTFGGLAFSTVSLTAEQWLITVGIGALSLPVGVIIRLIPDFCEIERRYNEDATPLTSYSRLNWEGAIGQIRNQLRVYSALRKSYHTPASTTAAPANDHHQRRFFSAPVSDTASLKLGDDTPHDYSNSTQEDYGATHDFTPSASSSP